MTSPSICLYELWVVLGCTVALNWPGTFSIGTGITFGNYSLPRTRLILRTFRTARVFLPCLGVLIDPGFALRPMVGIALNPNWRLLRIKKAGSRCLGSGHA